MAHKDLYGTKGVRTTAQSRVLEHWVPSEDATVVARLRAAGSILLGKLNMHEFAMGTPQASLFSPARNPWNLTYITGGSSSGSAAAVASGLCMGSLGSDTGGSIRGPASYCGIVGLKPTYGRVSRFGVIPLSWSLDHCGPMTWTVEDTALMLQAIAGYDPKDPTSSLAPVPRYVDALLDNVKGVSIGVPRDYFFDTKAGADPETLAVVERALAKLEELGARLEEVTISSLECASVATNVIELSEAFAYHKRNLQVQPKNYGDAVRQHLYLGGLFTANDLVQAHRVRNRVKREFTRALQKVDVLAMPTRPTPAVPVEDFDHMSVLKGRSFTAPFNQPGVPAISVPCGFNKAGLPIGLQIAGKPFDEPGVLRVAYAYQQHAGWYEKRPPIEALAREGYPRSD